MGFYDTNRSIVVLVVCLTTMVLIQPIMAGEKDSYRGEGQNLITSVPRTMSYQGILKDSGGDPVTDSTYSVTFRIFNVESGGSSLWDQILPCTTSIGYFDAVFSNVNLPFDEDYWLELEIDTEILDPRQKMNMTGYSARSDSTDYAMNSDLLDGLDSGDFAGAIHDHDTEYVNEGQADAISSAMILDGSIQFGDIGQNGAGTGQVMKWNGSDWAAAEDETGAGWNWSDSSSYGPDSVLFADSSNHADFSDSTDAITDGAVDFADIGENGAAYGQVMKWNGSGWVAAIDEVGAGGGGWIDEGNIVRLETSTDSVGIGTNTPSEKLHLAGNLLVTGKGTIGTGHTNTGYFAFVAGTNNTASGDYSIVSGGVSNTAGGTRSTIGGGASNVANADDAVVSGGWGNAAGGEKSVVAGGVSNTANGYSDAIGGGYQNSADSNYSVIGGGRKNFVAGHYSVIPGGYADTITSEHSYLFGINSDLTQDSTFMVDMPHIHFGDESTGYEFPTSDGASDQVMVTDGSGQLGWSDISSDGGWADDGTVVRLETTTDSVGIGTTTPAEKLDIDGNILVRGKATIGQSNTNTGSAAFVAGAYNTASGDLSVVGGGVSNEASGNRSTIGGGWYDTTKAVLGGVFSGYSNIAGDVPEDTAALVCGGYDNSATAKYSSVGGGIENSASGGWATVGGGWSNNASETYSTISGGVGNAASGMGAAIGGGFNNSADDSYSTVSGGNGNAAGNIYSNVNGGRENNVTGSYGNIGGGRKNFVGGSYSAISGGYADTITSNYSFLFGIDSELTQDSTLMVDMPHIRFGDETDGYEFPASDGAADQVMATDGNGLMSWVDMSGDGGGWVDDGTVVRLEASADSVGIGTASPTEKLDVSGNIKASGTITSGSSIIIDGSTDKITATGGTIDFDNENLITTGKATIGPGHTNTGASAFVAGASNNASGDYAAAVGGQSNIAGASWSCAGGGQGNQASNVATTVGGGVGNYATGYISTIGGGNNNTASGRWSTIAGGVENTAEDTASAVGGGRKNSARGIYSVVAGGKNNKARGMYSVVAGGGGPDPADSNLAFTTCSSIGGGQRNVTRGYFSTIGGGRYNRARGQFSVIAGGGGYALEDSNSAVGFYTAIGGGKSNSARGSRSSIGGGEGNITISAHAAIGGGLNNTVDGSRATISGGEDNLASGIRATIGGGHADTASGDESTVAGGQMNVASAEEATVGGGLYNRAEGSKATVGGGYKNIASGSYSTIPGGRLCSATGPLSFAAGNLADASDSGSVVIAANQTYSSVDTIASGGKEQMVLRADGGLFITNTGGVAAYDNTKLITTRGGAYLSGNGTNWTNASDENIKENFKPVDGFKLLQRIAELPISQWNYRCDEENVTHIGPTAQDFFEAFGLGCDDKSISTVDPAGVALAGMKALIQENRELKDLINHMERRITELENR
jgi:hypothetical protein